MRTTNLLGLTAAIVVTFTAASSRAQSMAWDSTPASGTSEETTRDARDDVPQAGLAYSAFGAARGHYGAAGVGAVSGSSSSRTDGSGGARIWGSPVERLTVMGGAQRELGAEFAPFATVMVRVAGSAPEGWAVAALGTYKTEGFDALGGEAELGALASWSRHGMHADINTLAGTGTESRELDGEARLRAGYDVARFLRLGADGQIRYRVAGNQPLPGGRTWDVVGGPQAVIGGRAFFGALTAGPSTTGVAHGIGWVAMLTLGGGTF